MRLRLLTFTLCMACALGASAAQAGQIDFNAAAAELYPQMTELRRYLHMNPELGDELPLSSARIREILTENGIEFRQDSHMNIVALIKGGRKGRTLIIRADYDALPVQEQTGLEYASRTAGRMHACGHDIHTAGAMGAALIIKRHQAEWPGNVFICFQSAEETGGGSSRMIVESIREQGGADGAVAMHTYGELIPHGTYAIRSGAVLAGHIPWEIEITGKPGHGASPWMGVDAIKPAAETVLRITAMQSSVFDTTKPFVVSPCIFRSNSDASNITSDKVTIQGSIRYFDPELKDAVPERMRMIAENVAASYGATASMTYRTEGNNIPVINSPEAAELATDVISSLGKKSVEKIVEMGSDDFCDFLQAFGGIYIFCGIHEEGTVLGKHHSGFFNPDERAIEDNTAVLAAYAYRFCSGR